MNTANMVTGSMSIHDWVALRDLAKARLLLETAPQDELIRLIVRELQLKSQAEAAEVLREKAKELSATADSLHDALWASANPTDHRTKAWKDHNAASRASNMAWHDFNNALRNIGLTVCESNRKAKEAKVL